MSPRFSAEAITRLAQRSGDPAWLRERRLDAFKRFEDLPWPSAATEQWKHTDLRKLAIEDFSPEPEARAAGAVPDHVRAQAIGEAAARSGLAFQIDADVVETTLSPDLAAKGVVFGPIGSVAAAHEEPVRAALGQGGVSDSELKIASLVEAFASGGTFLYVPRGVDVELPIQSVRWLSHAGGAVFPRVVIVADEAASVTYIDQYGSDDVDGLVASTVEIYAHPASTVNYLAVQDVGQRVWHFNVQRAVAQRDSTIRSLAASIGGLLARSVVESVLRGQGAHAEMVGVYFGDNDQHLDHRTLQLHQGPNTSSEVFYKGALKGRSSAVYSGLVDIEPGGVQTDAQQSNRNLLLSPYAKADASPFLEIKTSEVVRASHGVSVGRPDDQVLFYLRSRGLSREQAERVFVTGFFQEVIDRVPVAQIRSVLEGAVERELAEAD